MTVTPPAKITEFRNSLAKGRSAQILLYAAKLQWAGHNCAGRAKMSFSVLKEVSTIQMNGKMTNSPTAPTITQRAMSSVRRSGVRWWRR